MAVDSQWRLYYNDAWVATHTVEENATLLIHEVEPSAARPRGTQEGRGHQGPPALEHRRRLRNQRRSPRGGTAAAGRSAAARQVWTAERRHRRELLQAAADSASSGQTRGGAMQQPWRTAGRARTANGDSGNCRLTMGAREAVPGVDRIKAELVRREVARRIDEMSLLRRRCPCSPGVAGPARRSRRRSTTWRPSVTRCAEPCATARSADTTARTGGRIAGRPATASSSWPASTSRGRGRGF